MFHLFIFNVKNLVLTYMVQGECREQNFDIKKETNGKSYTVVQRNYIVNVTNNFMEIHLFWAGKGTCCIPVQGYYGPSISALSVSSFGTDAYLAKSTINSRRSS